MLYIIFIYMEYATNIDHPPHYYTKLYYIAWFFVQINIVLGLYNIIGVDADFNTHIFNIIASRRRLQRTKANVLKINNKNTIKHFYWLAYIVVIFQTTFV